MNSSPVVFVLVDACRSRYLDEGLLPRLAACAERGRHAPRMTPGAGFCERSEIFSGASPARTDNFTAYGFDPEGSPYREHAGYFRWLSHLPGVIGQKVATRLARRLAWRRGITMPPHRIPVDSLCRLRLTEDANDHFAPGGLGVDSLADRMRAAGKTWSWHFTAVGVPNGDDDDRLDALEAALPEGHDLYLAYIETTDQDGHYLGPDSDEMRAALARFDDWFMDRVERWRRVCPDLRLVVVGDHGMTTVTRKIDVSAEVAKIAAHFGWRVGPGRDVEYFLDSTLARFWFNDPTHREPFARALARSPLSDYGQLVDAEMRERYHLPTEGRLYGDLLWWADPGVLVWPDFFHRPTDGVLGMHGYVPEHEDSRGFALIEGPGIAPDRVEGAHLRDLAATLADLIGVETPRDNEGRSLLVSPAEVTA